MLCTNSMNFLMIPQWKVALNYNPPKNYPKFDPKKANLIITWDILMQNFRMINLEKVELIERYDASDEGFGPAFNEKFLPMTPAEKMKWMDS